MSRDRRKRLGSSIAAARAGCSAPLFPRRLLLADDLAYRVHLLAHPAPNVALGLLSLAFAFKVAVAYGFAGLLLNRAGGLLEAAFNALPVHRVSPFLPHVIFDQRPPGEPRSDGWRSRVTNVCWSHPAVVRV